MKVSTVEMSKVIVLLNFNSPVLPPPASLVMTVLQAYSPRCTILCIPWLSYTPPSTNKGCITDASVSLTKNSLAILMGVKANGTHDDAITALAMGNLAALNLIGGRLYWYVESCIHVRENVNGLLVCKLVEPITSVG